MIITNANITWDDKGFPYSKDFNDVYFYENGYNESEYVFLEQNNLASRFNNLKNDTNFVIGETGFGTGLNFLNTLNLWDKSVNNSSYLTYISTEKFPLSYKDLKKSFHLWPDLKKFSQILLKKYPKIIFGSHYLEFYQNRVRLILLFGDAKDCLNNLTRDIKVDAWFLDGFNPKQNKDLWSKDIFQSIANLSKIGTTFSTFTASSQVRKDLNNAGFQVKKKKGFGKKREMLYGELLSLSEIKDNKPWFIKNCISSSYKKYAIVIGGGLAGCTTASSLANNGWKVNLIERKAKIASSASANKKAILHFNPSVSANNILNDFRIRAYLYSVNYFNKYINSNIWNKCSILQLSNDNITKQKQIDVVNSNLYPNDFVKFVDKSTASKLSGIDLCKGGLFFLDSGFVNIIDLCKDIINNNNIIVSYNTNILRLKWLNDKKLWLVLDNHGNKIDKAPVVVIANAGDAVKFEQVNKFSIKYLHGQCSLIPESNISKKLKTIIYGKNFITPSVDGVHSLGATFSRDINSNNIDNNNKLNFFRLKESIPILYKSLDFFSNIDEFYGFRCFSIDDFPLVGQVPNYTKFINDYKLLGINAKTKFDKRGEYLPGLYLNIAHGSHGVMSCLISSELISSFINNRPQSLKKDIIDALNPARFIIRDLKKQKFNS